MTTATTTHPLPAVHAYETDDEMVVEIELPADGEGAQIKVDTGLLAVTVPLPHPTPHRWNNPDATPS
jgi:HSP20 family molecular chaperone IbpA